MNSKFEDFKIVGKIRKLNILIQIVLGVVLFVGLNIVAQKHYLRVDYSDTNKNSLSPETQAYVKNLGNPIDIYAVLSSNTTNDERKEEINTLKSLLNQYEYISDKNTPIKVHIINAHINNKRAQELVGRFGKDLEDSIIIASGPKFKRIPIVEFFEDSQNDKNRIFRGEQIISTALLSVSSAEENKIYFLKGHGEMSMNSTNANTGLSEFTSVLQTMNYTVEELDLSKQRQVPEDADLIIIASPQTNLLPREVDSLRKYLLNNKGKLMIFFGIGSQCGLEDILFEWGLRSDDMLILDASGDYESASGDLIARTYPKKPHDMVKYLIKTDMPVQFGSVRPVRQDEGSPIDQTLKLESIILSAEGSWAEKSYLKAGMQTYNGDVDLLGPLPLAMIASRTGNSDLGIKIDAGKLVVFGDENFISNKYFSRLGNAKLATNAINWIFDDDDMLNIEPRKLDSFSITLSHGDILGLSLRLLCIPAIVLFFAILTWILRRN